MAAHAAGLVAGDGWLASDSFQCSPHQLGCRRLGRISPVVDGDGCSCARRDMATDGECVHGVQEGCLLVPTSMGDIKGLGGSYKRRRAAALTRFI